MGAQLIPAMTTINIQPILHSESELPFCARTANILVPFVSARAFSFHSINLLLFNVLSRLQTFFGLRLAVIEAFDYSSRLCSTSESVPPSLSVLCTDHVPKTDYSAIALVLSTLSASYFQVNFVRDDRNDKSLSLKLRGHCSCIYSTTFRSTFDGIDTL